MLMNHAGGGGGVQFGGGGGGVGLGLTVHPTFAAAAMAHSTLAPQPPAASTAAAAAASSTSASTAAAAAAASSSSHGPLPGQSESSSSAASASGTTTSNVTYLFRTPRGRTALATVSPSAPYDVFVRALLEAAARRDGYYASAALPAKSSPSCRDASMGGKMGAASTTMMPSSAQAKTNRRSSSLVKFRTPLADRAIANPNASGGGGGGGGGPIVAADRRVRRKTAVPGLTKEAPSEASAADSSSTSTSTSTIPTDSAYFVHDGKVLGREEYRHLTARAAKGHRVVTFQTSPPAPSSPTSVAAAAGASASNSSLKDNLRTASFLATALETSRTAPPLPTRPTSPTPTPGPEIHLTMRLRLLGGMTDRQNRVGSKFGGGGVSSSQNSERERKDRLRELALESIDLARDPYLMRNHLGTYECKLCLTLHTNEANYLAHTQGKKHQSGLARRAMMEKKKERMAGTDSSLGPTPLTSATGASSNQSAPRVRIGRPGYEITKSRDPRTHQRCLTFYLHYPELDDPRTTQPRHRFMSAYEQRVDTPPDRNYQYLLVACEPYETVAFKIPNEEIDRGEGRFVTNWDASAKRFTLTLYFVDAPEGDAEGGGGKDAGGDVRMVTATA